MKSGKTRTKEKENKRNAILKAARKLFFERGFKAVTVDNIAADARLSKGTIYLYFESKEEIYVQILINDNIELHKKINKLPDKEASASELLLELAKFYADFFLTDNELFRILTSFMIRIDEMNLTQEQNTSLVRTSNDNIEIIGDILQKGINTGEFLPDINVRQMQNVMWGLLNGIISLYLFTGAPSERAKKLHSMVKDGLKVFLKGLKQR